MNTLGESPSINKHAELLKPLFSEKKTTEFACGFELFKSKIRKPDTHVIYLNGLRIVLEYIVYSNIILVSVTQEYVTLYPTFYKWDLLAVAVENTRMLKTNIFQYRNQITITATVFPMG